MGTAVVSAAKVERSSPVTPCESAPRTEKRYRDVQGCPGQSQLLMNPDLDTFQNFFIYTNSRNCVRHITGAHAL